MLNSHEQHCMEQYDLWMKTFSEVNRPLVGVQDRSLEGFRQLLDSLKIQTKSITDPRIKQQIYQLVNPFYSQMAELLKNYKQQGIGYSARHEYQPPVGVMGNTDSSF